MTVDAKQQKWHDATVLNLVLKQNTQFHTKHKYALQKQYRPTFPLFIHKFHLLYYIKSLRGSSNNNITDLFLKAKLCITNLEAVAQTCSVKKLFRKVLQNLHGSTCASLYLKQTPIQVFSCTICEQQQNSNTATVNRGFWQLLIKFFY